MLKSTFVTKLRTWIFGQRVGMDAFGNVYYQAPKLRDAFGRPKRWVVFQGLAEPSKVPGHWHGWLHYSCDLPLSSENDYPWQQAHLPNLTGTPYAYQPTSGSAQEKVPSYQAWKPTMPKGQSLDKRRGEK